MLLTNIGAIKQLSREQAAHKPPVRFRGVATGGTPSIGDLFVQDDTGGVYLVPSGSDRGIGIGDLVEVEGVAEVLAFSPLVQPSRVTRLGVGRLPPPKPVSGDDLLLPSIEGLRVEVEGLVVEALRDTRFAKEGYPREPIALRLLVSGVRVNAAVWKPGMDEALLGCVGAYVRLGGICTPVPNRRGQAIRRALLVNEPDTFRILEPGPTDLKELPLTSLDNLLRYEERQPPHRLQRVTGTVTALSSRYSLFIQDDSQSGILVHTLQPVEFAAGDEVSLVGWARPATLPGSPQLEEIRRYLENIPVSFTAERASRTGSRPLPEAITVTEPTITHPDFQHQRVVFVATIASVSQSKLTRDYQFTCDLGGTLVETFTFHCPAQTTPAAVGSQVQVTGVLEQLVEADPARRNLRVHLASLTDMVLLAPPPAHHTTLLLWMVGGATGVAAATLAWALALRRAVRTRTAALAGANTALAAANTALASANAAKSQFVANMSHEIRTPMNAVLGLVQVLHREPLSQAQHQIVQRVAHAGRSLMRILNDILDFSKMEANRLSLEERAFDLPALLAQVDALYREEASRKGLQWQIDGPATPLSWFRGDPVRIEQVLSNLVSNAIKFTREGSVQVRTRVAPGLQGKARLRFEVVDTGPGIDRDTLSGLFRPFVQADESISRQFGGTGLGLAIAKSLVELMGGQLGAESQPGLGSTFWVELVLDQATPGEAPLPLSPKPAPRQSPRLGNRRFLVVDDNPLNLDLVEHVLLQEGSSVERSTGGKEALARLRQEPVRFDAVLMDLQMPGTSGLEAIRAIRREVGLKLLPIVAVSATVLPEQIQESRDAGANDFVPKPLDVEQLVATLVRWLPDTKQSVAGGPATPTITTTPSPPGAGFPAVAGLDTRHAALCLNNDPAFFVRCLHRFRDEFGSLPQQLAEAWVQGHHDEVTLQLHTLRGFAGSIGALSLGETAAALEKSIRAAAPDCGHLVEEFAAQLGRLLMEIRRLEPASPTTGSAAHREPPQQGHGKG